MDLTDEQWEVVKPLIPIPPRPVPMDVAGRGSVIVTCSMAFCGSCVPVRPGTICQIGIRHTRPATAASRSGFARVCLRRF
jgi:hypothetical protein